VAPVAATSNGGTSRVIGGEKDTAEASKQLGADNGGGIRQCVKGDESPAGTIVDGYKKRISSGMFGTTCMWEKVNP
jgi:hypothetical protein